MRKPYTRSWTDDDLVRAVETSQSKSEILIKLGLKVLGGNYKVLDKHLKRLQLSVEHYNPHKAAHLKRVRIGTQPKPLDEILVENGSMSSHALKKRVLAAGLLEYKCSRCQISEWQGVRLSLQLDHINGIHDDNRLENLRILCPNCHSLTSTYCGKNKRILAQGTIREAPPKEHPCLLCSNPVVTKGKSLCRHCSQKQREDRHGRTPKVLRTGVVCPNCAGVKDARSLQCWGCTSLQRQESGTKIQWPPLEELKARLKTSNYSRLGKELGVSDNAVRKHMRVQGERA